MQEVEEAKMAQERASSPEVKAFAQQLENDHTKANDELGRLVQSKGMPADQMAAKPATSRLSKLNGAAFDRAYVDAQVLDHEQAVALFGRESTSGTDADLKAFATKTLPTLREHLKMARDLRTKVSATKSATTSTPSKSSGTNKSTTSTSRGATKSTTTTPGTTATGSGTGTTSGDAKTGGTTSR